ncbi:MAG: LCP family protein [Acidimicrobiales bacterium]
MVAPLAEEEVAPPPPPSPPSPPARPRRWPRRLLVGVSIFTALALLVVGGGYAYFRWRFGQIKKVSIGSVPVGAAGEPFNVLLVGSDSRANLTGFDAKQAGKGRPDTAGQRSDTIIVLHVNPKVKKAVLLSIPRDLYVPIDGTNRSDRVNSAFGGGPELLVRTITRSLGIQINHYAEVDFVGFKGIVDTVGGVHVYVPTPARDAFSGLDIKNPGCLKFNGETALQWVRSRHYQYFESGRWRYDPNSDFSRIQRQQDFLRRVMKKAVSTGLTNPIQLNDLIGTGVKYLTIDSGFSSGQLVKLARRFRTLDPDTIEMLTLPTTPFVGPGGADLLRLKQPEAQAFIDRVNGKDDVPASGPGGAGGGAPAPTVPAIRTGEVRVTVLNGSGGAGLAGRVDSALQGAGFIVASKGDADNFRYRHTVIRYAAGERAKAEVLQAHLEGPPADLVEVPLLRPGTVDTVLVVGADFAGVRTQTGVVGTPNAAAATTPASTPATLAPPPTAVPTPRGAPPAPPCAA